MQELINGTWNPMGWMFVFYVNFICFSLEKLMKQKSPTDFVFYFSQFCNRIAPNGWVAGDKMFEQSIIWIQWCCHGRLARSDDKQPDWAAAYKQIRTSTVWQNMIRTSTVWQKMMRKSTVWQNIISTSTVQQNSIRIRTVTEHDLDEHCSTEHDQDRQRSAEHDQD